MTNEELDKARAEEAAKRIKQLGTYGGSLPVYSISAITEAVRLACEGWTPPQVVDPDIAEAEKLANEYAECDDWPFLANWFLKAIKRGRELERAVMGNPIPEQIQEVTPPEPVNPDLAEAEKLAYAWNVNEIKDVYGLALAAIKRGRALAAEAKPGRWSSWNGAPSSPVCDNDWVCVIYDDQSQAVGRAGDRGWEEVSSYLPIPKPEDVA